MPFSFTNVEWAYPWAFALLLALAAAILWKRKRGGEGRLLYSSLSLLFPGPRSLKARLSYMTWVLQAAALFFVIIALARPREPSAFERQNIQGIDILLALDISLSMLAPDMGGGMTRLQSAKRVLKDFISARPHDRKGLIVFSGESLTLSPLTLDSHFLQTQLEAAKVTENLKGGTAIGSALAHSAARMRSSPLKSRILIFLTDGENNTGFIDPATALTFLQKEGIKVYAVALGRITKGRAAVKIPVKGQQAGFRTVYIETGINEALLKEMAEKTNGAFFKASDKQALQAIFSEIDRLEKQILPASERLLYKELFYLPLTLAAALYLLSALLSATWLFRAV